MLFYAIIRDALCCELNTTDLQIQNDFQLNAKMFSVTSFQNPSPTDFQHCRFCFATCSTVEKKVLHIIYHFHLAKRTMR